MSKEKTEQTILRDWAFSLFLPGGKAQSAWRLCLVLMLALNVVLLIISQGNSFKRFFQEGEQLYDIMPYPKVEVNDLTVFLYGPAMLGEAVEGRAEVQVHNNGTQSLKNVRIALIAPEGNIRISAGDPLPNIFQISELPGGADSFHTFDLTPLASSGQGLPLVLDLSMSYRLTDISATSSITEVTTYAEGVYAFQQSDFSDSHRLLRRVLNIGRGGAATLNELRLNLTALFVAIGALIALLVIGPSKWLVKMYTRIRRWVQGVEEPEKPSTPGAESP